LNAGLVPQTPPFLCDQETLGGVVALSEDWVTRSAIEAACIQVFAISKNISRSRSLRAVFAQPKHSSAYSRYSFGEDMAGTPLAEADLPPRNHA
jgi:hypothetical protein